MLLTSCKLNWLTFLVNIYSTSVHISYPLRACESLTSSLVLYFLQRILDIYTKLSHAVYRKLSENIPGFSTIMEKVYADAAVRDARRKARRSAKKKAEEEELYRRLTGDR